MWSKIYEMCLIDSGAEHVYSPLLRSCQSTPTPVHGNSFMNVLVVYESMQQTSCIVRCKPRLLLLETLVLEMERCAIFSSISQPATFAICICTESTTTIDEQVAVPPSSSFLCHLSNTW